MDQANKTFLKQQIASLPVWQVIGQLTEYQASCQLLQEDLCTRAQFHDVGVQQLHVFWGDVQILLDVLQGMQEGETVDKAMLDKRDAAIRRLERYMDELSLTRFDGQYKWMARSSVPQTGRD